MQAALNYHSSPKPGKISIAITKPASSSNDLAMAYSPGVAAPVRAIAQNSDLAYKYTAKGNLVGVISNGSAILGLGNLGALASKPVMEGKSILFKQFAGVDAFDIGIDTTNTDEFVKAVSLISRRCWFHYSRDWSRCWC